MVHRFAFLTFIKYLTMNHIYFPSKESYILTAYLGDSPAELPQLIQGPVFSYRSVREADSVPSEKSLGCM